MYRQDLMYQLINSSRTVNFSPMGLVWFHGISTGVGYLMPDPFFYSCTLNI